MTSDNSSGQLHEITFTLTIEAQTMRVRFRPERFAGYGHFEFTSPHQPKRRIPVSETGYLSYFAPMWQIAEAPSAEAYAQALALEMMNRQKDDEKAAPQLALF